MAYWVLLKGVQWKKNHTNHMIVTITMATNEIVKFKYPLSSCPHRVLRSGIHFHFNVQCANLEAPAIL